MHATSDWDARTTARNWHLSQSDALTRLSSIVSQPIKVVVVVVVVIFVVVTVDLIVVVVNCSVDLVVVVFGVILIAVVVAADPET